MGASSFSPSPITTTPRIDTVPMSARMASTAAPSPPFLSPRPTHRPAAIAAASVTRTSSRARLRSGAGRPARKPRPVVLGGYGLSGPGSRTGPPGRRTPSFPPFASSGRGPGRGHGREVGRRACDPRCMTGTGPTSQRPEDEALTEAPGPAPAPGSSPAIERANRMNAANMLRSLLPLVVICLLLVAWVSFRQQGDEGVRTVDPTSTVQLAAARASYAVPVPTGLGKGYRSTSARTDAGDAAKGDPVTMEIGYLTPSEEFAGFVVSDDRRAAALKAVLDGAKEKGSVDLGGTSWTRSATARGETALIRDADGVTVVVSGSASERELEAVAASVRPYDG